MRFVLQFLFVTAFAAAGLLFAGDQRNAERTKQPVAVAILAAGAATADDPIGNVQVTYADGTKATLDQTARDITEFLAWASEPHLEARNRTGIRVVLFLLAFAGLMYALKRQVWADKH